MKLMTTMLFLLITFAAHSAEFVWKDYGEKICWEQIEETAINQALIDFKSYENIDAKEIQITANGSSLESLPPLDMYTVEILISAYNARNDITNIINKRYSYQVSSKLSGPGKKRCIENAVFRTSHGEEVDRSNNSQDVGFVQSH